MTDKEREFKVKLEDIVILAESVIKLANEVYALHRLIEMGNEEVK